MSTTDYSNRLDELPERFRTKFEIVDTGFDTPCWLWTAAKCSGGYGNFRIDGKIRPAHRYSYETLIGTIPVGLVLDHSVVCTNPSCVNPGHVEAVTIATNTVRGNSPSCISARTNYCVKGHEFTADNTIKHGNGRRQCRLCKAAKDVEYRILHAEKNRVYKAIYYQEHKSEIRAKQNDYYQENSERIKLTVSQHNNDHRDEISTRRRERYNSQKSVP